MKKFMAMLLILGLAASAFAGGRQSGSTGTGNKGTLSDGTKTLRIFKWGTGSQQVTSFDYKDNLFTKKIVDETGINLEFVTATSADVNERLNIMLNTGDYPDIIDKSMSLADLNFYAKEGIFVPLDQYKALEYPNIKKYIDQYPGVVDLIKGTDGKTYALPYVNDCLHCRYDNYIVKYYNPFLKNANYKVPETLDEFTAYLRWVKNNDVNGNGDKNDEIPFAFAKDYNDIRNAVAYFANAFMQFVRVNHWGLERNGRQITEQYKLAPYREALSYMAGLYKEGLINQDAFTLSYPELIALTARNPQIVASGIRAAANGTDFYYNALTFPILKGPTGEQHSLDAGPWASFANSWYITDKNKEPELSIALANYILDDKVLLDLIYGPKGVGWTDPTPGALSISGEPATYKLLGPFGSAPLNSCWYYCWEALANFTHAFRYGEEGTDVPTIKRYLETGDPSLVAAMRSNGSYNGVNTYVWAERTVQYGTPDALGIPPLPISAADTRRMADIDAVLDGVIDQAIAEFVTGIRDISNNAAWNSYIADLDRAGSKEKVTILQSYLK